MYLLNTLQHPDRGMDRIYIGHACPWFLWTLSTISVYYYLGQYLAQRNGGGLHIGLAALAGHRVWKQSRRARLWCCRYGYSPPPFALIMSFRVALCGSAGCYTPSPAREHWEHFYCPALRPFQLFQCWGRSRTAFFVPSRNPSCEYIACLLHTLREAIISIITMS